MSGWAGRAPGLARGAPRVHNRSMRASVVALVALASGACAELGVVGDGTTVSVGRAADGFLVDGVELPDQGTGFVVPARWRARGSEWGTDELVGLVTRTAGRLAAASPGAVMRVADLSRPGGGPGPHHRSHQSGRDVDLLFFVTDAAGRPVGLEEMRHFGEDGTTVDGGPRLRFDVHRTWLMVRALLEDREVAFDHVFIYAPLRARLLDHARAIGEPDSLVAWAGELLSQPSDSAPHDDHMHVRIRCAASDATCEDVTLPRIKKPAPVVPAELAAALAARPIVGAPWLHGPRW